MNEDEILELTYRCPAKIVDQDFNAELSTLLKDKTSEEKIEMLQKLKLEIMARNPRVMGIPMPDTHTKKGIMTKYGKKMLEEGAKYYKQSEPFR